MKRILITITIGLFIAALFPNCAKVVSPTGGPKDTIPPVMLRSIPKLNATNFNQNKLTFEFDEYVQLKDFQQKLLVSPPMSNKPQVKIRGKKIEMELVDTLKENTTYSVYLGDAIVDNNEGNPIKSFEFAFSTGPLIDSLSLKGMVLNSFTNEPVEGVYVMLYDSFADSLPYKQKPMHIARTNKKGEFKLNNLKHIDYKLVAIGDANSNYMYNQGTEDIAFEPEKISKSQLLNGPDTISSKKDITLRMFREGLPNQIITGYDRPLRNQFVINFSRKPVGDYSFKPLNETISNNWYIPEPDAEGDTIKFWITSNKLISLDTIKLIASYLKTDSLNRLNSQQDTLKLIYYNTDDNSKSSSKGKKKGKDDVAEKDTNYFALSANIKTGDVALPTIPTEFTLPIPAKSVDSKKIMIFNDTDSIMESEVTLLKDSINPRIYRFDKQWATGKEYKMLVLPGTFVSITSKQNDTLRLVITGADPENFGTITIKTSNVSKGLVAELLTEKGKVVDTKSAVGNNPISFTFITPGKYKLRFIEDLNMNGRWDSGNYLKGIQPEKVFEFTGGKNKGEINIRANWESEIDFAVPKP